MQHYANDGGFVQKALLGMRYDCIYYYNGKGHNLMQNFGGFVYSSNTAQYLYVAL